MRGAAQIAAKVLPAILSDVGHGSHLCAFYETKKDLTYLVLPFFDAGRSRGELCVWMMPNSVTAEEAAAVAAKHGIELRPGRELYKKGPHFDPGPVVDLWNAKLQQALAASCSGMRASGDAFWLQSSDWEAFLDYEADLTNMIADKPITLLYTYPLSLSKAGDLLDVARAPITSQSQSGKEPGKSSKDGELPRPLSRHSASPLRHWMPATGFYRSAHASVRCSMGWRKAIPIR